MSVTKEAVIERLRTVRGPDFDGDIVSLGMVSDIFIADAKVFFSITVPAARAQELEPLRAAAERVVKAIPGVAGAVVALTAEKKGGGMEAPIPPRPPRRRCAPRRPPAAAPRPAPHAPASHSQGKRGVPGIEAIIAVASGKGGVGKSTTAVNIALGLAANGLKVGVLDADIYGPSMPRLLNIHGRPQTVDGKILKPMENYGLKVMSMGFLVDEETPMIWRGPMVMSALTQMLREVEWGAARRAGRRHAARHRRRPAHHGAAGAAGRRRHRLDAAGPGADRRPQGPEHVQEGRRAAARHRREHELFHRARHRQALRHFRPWRRAQGGRAARRHLPRRSAAARWGSAKRSDAGTPVVVSKPDGAEARIYRDIAAKVWERLDEERGRGRSRAGDRVRVARSASGASPLTFALNVEKNSPASFFEVEVISRLPSCAILPPTSAFAAYLSTRHVRRLPRSG